MSHAFVVIDAHIRLPKQKQDAALARLNETIAHNSFLQGEAEVFLFEYQKQKGNEPLSFSAVVELWGWYPTFEEKTGDLIGLTSFQSEIEDDELLVQHFLELLGLDDGDYVDVDIDHLRRRYRSFRGKISRLDATYVYPSVPATEMAVSTADRAFLESEGNVLFTNEGMIFPVGTVSSQGVVSTSHAREATLWRYYLPTCQIEVSVKIISEGGLEIREASIPFEGLFWFAQSKNNDPAVLARYNEYAFSCYKQNWSNEYGDFPCGPGVAIASSESA